MVLRFNSTTTRPTGPDQQSLYPDGQHTSAFYIKCAPPVGLATYDRKSLRLFSMRHPKVIGRPWIFLCRIAKAGATCSLERNFASKVGSR